MLASTAVLVGAVAGASAQTQYTSTAVTAVAKAAATALTLSPTSNIAGATFDRFVQIFLENTDYSLAIGDREYKAEFFSLVKTLLMQCPVANLSYLASQGILLNNYFATTHPSQVIYVLERYCKAKTDGIAAQLRCRGWRQHPWRH
jgi:hypothetical protein